MHAGGVVPGVAVVACNPALSPCDSLAAYATWELGAAWSGVGLDVVHYEE